MGSFFKQVAGIWQRMETPQRVSMVLIAVVFAGILVAVGVGATRPDYTLLASGLTEAETARIASYLQDQNVPYHLADRDTTILVPRAQRYQLLHLLSEQELLTDESDGFEILGEGGMGESTFMEHKRYDRAVAGELERAIREVDGVVKAHVLLQRPKESPFIRDERPATAAVKLTMRSGKRLNDRQLSGIIHLVAGAIGDLAEDNIQVMDDQGLLTRPDQDPRALAASTSLEAERALEQHLMHKAQAVLDRALGIGRSLVTIAVDLDFAKRTESASVPTGSVIAESRTRETDESTPVPGTGGLAGTVANVESAAGGDQRGAENATSSTAEETTRYVTGQKTSTLDDEVGRVRGMSVSILLDHQQRQEAPSAEATVGDDATAEPVPVWEPFDSAEQERFKQLVLDAIGFDAAKGVQLALEPESNAAERFTVTVQSMRLQRPEESEPVATAVSPAIPGNIDTWIRYGVAAIVALGLLLVARGQLKRSHVAWTAEQDRRAGLTETEEEEDLPDAIKAAKQEEEQRRTLKQQIQEQVEEDPDSAVAVLRGWIHNAE